MAADTRIPIPVSLEPSAAEAALATLEALSIRTNQITRAFVEVVRPYGLSSWTTAHALLILSRVVTADCRVGDLAAQLGTSRTNATALADVLERAGLVARVPSRTDRRAVYLRLTAKGLAVVDAITAPLEAAALRLLLDAV